MNDASLQEAINVRTSYVLLLAVNLSDQENLSLNLLSVVMLTLMVQLTLTVRSNGKEDSSSSKESRNSNSDQP